MIEIEKFHSRVAALETLMQTKLGVRGPSLSARFKRAGRRLPRRIQKAGRVISEAQTLSANPKLARMLDPKRLNAAFADVTTHLETIDPVDRRKGLVLGVLGGMVFNLILLIAAILALLYWQDVI